MNRAPLLAVLAAALAAGPAIAQEVADEEPNLGGEARYEARDPAYALEHLHPAEGYEVSLFASEQDFPIGNPVALAFDSRGRLWVATMPSYPQRLPDEEPDDKIVILEDRDGDGRADHHTVFASGLHVPTGFELGDGGVYVAQQPNLMFIEDTDGDDVGRPLRSHPPRLRHRGQPPLDLRLHLGTRRRALLPGGRVPPQPGRNAPRPRAAGRCRRVPLQAEPLPPRGLRLLPLRQSLGPHLRPLGSELHRRRLRRLELLRRPDHRQRALPDEAAADEGVHLDRPADLRLRDREFPPLPRRGAGQLPDQQHHRFPGHQAAPGDRGGLGLHLRGSRASPLLDRHQLPARRSPVQPRTARSTSSTGSTR